jgi:hypothetical protein
MTIAGLPSVSFEDRTVVFSPDLILYANKSIYSDFWVYDLWIWEFCKLTALIP